MSVEKSSCGLDGMNIPEFALRGWEQQGKKYIRMNKRR